MSLGETKKARRGQPVAKPVARPVWHLLWHEDWEHEQHRESHRERDREMLARVKEFDGDVHIGIESKLPKVEFDQELKDGVTESRRVLRRESYENRFERGLEFKCLRESL